MCELHKKQIINSQHYSTYYKNKTLKIIGLYFKKLKKKEKKKENKIHQSN